MKSVLPVALIGGVLSVAASLLPAELGQAWGPLVMLSSAVLTLGAWVVAGDRTSASHGHTISPKKAA